MTAPERIWAWGFDRGDGEGRFYTGPCHWMGRDAAEYILHTRAALAASPLVQEIVAEAVKAEREVTEQFRETNRRMNRRLQVLEGFWQRKVDRARYWMGIYLDVYMKDRSVKSLEEAAYQRGYDDGYECRFIMPKRRAKPRPAPPAAIRARGEGQPQERGE